MKGFYRLAFIFFICLAAFFAGWIARGFYLPRDLRQSGKAAEALSKAEIETGQNGAPDLPEKPLPGGSSEESRRPAESKASGAEPSPAGGHPLFFGLRKPDSAESPSAGRPSKPAPRRAEKKPEGFEARQADYDAMNREQLLLISGEQRIFALRGQYSFLINAFSREEKALKYIKSLKERFPLWSFLIKAKKQKLKIYIGPFETEKSASEFIKALPDPSPFPGYFLETMPL